MSPKVGKLGALNAGREHLRARDIPPRTRSYEQGEIYAISARQGMPRGRGPRYREREPLDRRSGGARDQRGRTPRVAEDFSLEEVLREWVLPRGYRGELPRTKAGLRRLALERETIVREDEANRVNSERDRRDRARRTPAPPPRTRSTRQGPQRQVRVSRPRSFSRIVADHELWEDRPSAFFPGTPATTAPVSEGLALGPCQTTQ